MAILDQLPQYGLEAQSPQDVFKQLEFEKFAPTAGPLVIAQMPKPELSEEVVQKYFRTGFYDSFNDLCNANLLNTEELLVGIRRKQVSMLVSATNVGKTTLMLNTALSACAGQICLPLLPEKLAHKPRKIAYFDFEATAPQLRDDVRQMLWQIDDRSSAEANFFPVVDAVPFEHEPLNLSNPRHLDYAIKYCKEKQVDIVVIDTISAAFDLVSENDNAEVKRRIMCPLKDLAIEANCAIIAIHHVGKRGESDVNEDAYMGRGASTFGALSRSVYTLTRDKVKGAGYVKLTQAKTKGVPIEPHLLHLNYQTRWFELCDEKPTPSTNTLTTDDIVDYISQQGEAKSKQIKEYFKSRAGERTVSERISQAEKLRLIYKASKNDAWKVMQVAEEVAIHS